MSYDEIEVHRTMLADRVRTEAYERAIAAVVKPGMRVLDLGCGTGILSFFAARAGADEVIAVDRSRLIREAQALAARNGLSRIRFFRGELDELSLDAKVDVIVSEWMGHFVFAESMLGPLLRARDRFLAPRGTLLPARLELSAGLVIDPALHAELAYFREPRYGIDFTPIADGPFHAVQHRTMPESAFAADVVPLGSLVMDTLDRDAMPLRGRTIATHAYTVVALAGWFDAELTPGIRFGTGPRDPKTHWMQVVFPLAEPLAIEPGDAVDVTIEPLAMSDDASVRMWRWSIASRAGRRVADDVVEQALLARPLPKGWL